MQVTNKGKSRLRPRQLHHNWGETETKQSLQKATALSVHCRW